MPKPNFKKNDPNAILARDYKEPKLSNKNAPTTVESTSALSEPQKNKSNDKRKQKYLRLDITDYQDYISLMAGYEKSTSGKYVSMTQYILRLIEKDKQKNMELYEKLEQIEKMKRELI